MLPCVSEISFIGILGRKFVNGAGKLGVKPVSHIQANYECVLGMRLYLTYMTYYLRAGRPRCRSSSPGKVKNVHFSISYRPVLGATQPPIQKVPKALSPVIKQPWREADHSPRTSAEIKKTWIYTSTPPYVFMA
jgi:hypothetical protein